MEDKSPQYDPLAELDATDDGEFSSEAAAKRLESGKEAEAGDFSRLISLKCPALKMEKKPSRCAAL